MLSVTGRKKPIASNAGIQIDTSVAQATLLKQPASHAISLYQQCSSLRSRLMRIHGFPYYFSLASLPESTDIVTQLWELFSYGIPLCYIFDQLPDQAGFNKINNSEFDPEQYETNPDRAKKRAIALFVMQIHTPKVEQTIPGCELFTVTDLWDRNSTNGLVKVINTVTAIVNYLPSDAFDPSPPPSLTSSQDASDSPTPDATSSIVPENAAWNNIIREIVETERKYVQDLELMQKYSNALSQSSLIDQDTIHLLFPNLNNLLNFQRKFLIRLESTAELPQKAQRWGQQFLESETDFIVYEPYCANYIRATELLLTNEENLVVLNLLINVKTQLPAFLIRPIWRICEYPLLLDSLMTATSDSSDPHYDEVKTGTMAAKRIVDRISEAHRSAENDQTVKSLQHRIQDWKGHHLENFGDLLLHDFFVVTKSGIDREYHIFLFEKIMLCCKEAVPPFSDNNRGTNKSGSIFKKQSSPSLSSLPGGLGQRQKNTPLLLKGRIFLSNVTQTVPVSPRNSIVSSIHTQYTLTVWWKGDDELENLVLRCRREGQMRQWEAQINYLKEAAIQRQLARSQIAGPKVHDLMRRGAAPRSQGSPSAHLPERQTGDLPPLNSPPHQLKVYQNLSLYIAQVLQERLWETDLIISFQKYMRYMAKLDSLSSLIHSRQCRLQLLQFSKKLKISSEPSVRLVLQKDEVEIIKVLQGILCSDVERKAVLSLQEDDALDFANLLQSTLDRGSLGDLHHDAQRLLVKLSILPSDLSMRGITLIDKNVIFGGGFADIFQASYQGQEVALKRMRVFQRGQVFQDIKQRFCREALLWQHLDHPHVLPFLGIDAETFSPLFCIVTPWMQHGTILQHISDYGGVNIDKQLLQVAQALEYLHIQQVVHGDLRGGNILIDNSWNVCVADFGLAGFVDATAHTSTTRNGSTRWMAPELHGPELFTLPSFQRTFASDVYAFACVCVEIYTGCAPFFNVKSDTAVILQVIEGKRPAQPLGNPGRPISDALWSIVQCCWMHDPSHRPSSSGVVDLIKDKVPDI